MAVGGFNLVDYFLALSIVAAVASWSFHRRHIYIDGWMMLPALTAILVAANATLVQGAASPGWQDMARVLLSTSALAILLTSLVVGRSRAVLRKVLAWWGCGIAVNSLASVLASLRLIDLSSALGQPTGDRLSGLSSHPNSIAFSISLALPVFVHLLGTARRWVGASWWLACLGVGIWGLMLADSRAGLLVGLLAFALAATFWLLTSRVRLLALPVFIVGALALSALLPGALAETRLAQGSEESDLGRAVFNGDSMTVFLSNPVFGGGFASQAGVAVPLMVLSAGGLVFAVGYYLFVFRPLPVLLTNWSDGFARTGALVLLVFLAYGMLNPVVVERVTFWAPLLAALWVLTPETTQRNPWRFRRDDLENTVSTRRLVSTTKS